MGLVAALRLVKLDRLLRDLHLGVFHDNRDDAVGDALGFLVDDQAEVCRITGSPVVQSLDCASATREV